MARIYVGNLPFAITDDELRAAFEAHGKVSSATIVIDRATGCSRGFGFVEMASDDRAMNAIEEMNGFDLDGRRLVVSVARPRATASKAAWHAA